MEYFKIGGRSYDVLVTAIEENFSILYSENTGRTLSDGAEMSLSPLGTFFSYKVTIRRKKGKEAEFDDLFDYISVPRENGIDISIVHNQGVWDFQGYISSGGRPLNKIKNNVVYWGETAINIIPMKAQVEP